MDKKKEYLDQLKADFPKHDVPFEERLASPEGKALVAELEMALAVAKGIVASNQEVTNLLFAREGGGGREFIIPLIWRDLNERDFIYSAVKMCLIAYNIESYVVVSEGWGCDEENYDPDIRNSDNPHRIEVLSVVAVSADLSISKQMEIIVDEHGDRGVKPMKLRGGEPIPHDGITEISGTMASLLPPKTLKISDSQRAALREILPFKPQLVNKVFGH